MKVVDFVIREMGELYAIDFLIWEFKQCSIKWNIYVIPYNSDLIIFNASKLLAKYYNVNIVFNPNSIPKICMGFESDISGKFQNQILTKINIYKLATCIDLSAGIKKNKNMKYDIVVSNVKINDKNPMKEYDINMWNLLGSLPYNIAVVPRHPFCEGFLKGIKIPKNITIFNQIGLLRTLCANASLVVMGLIFSDSEGETDHSPFESTINSNAISGIYDYIEPAYRSYYQKSGLIHQYKSFQNSIINIPDLINDPLLGKKLQLKKQRIEDNKIQYLSEIRILLFNN